MPRTFLTIWMSSSSDNLIANPRPPAERPWRRIPIDDSGQMDIQGDGLSLMQGAGEHDAATVARWRREKAARLLPDGLLGPSIRWGTEISRWRVGAYQ